MADSKNATLLSRLVLVKPGEGLLLVFSATFFFFILFGYYMLRPIRDAMGIQRSFDDLPWLMTGTLLAMILANPVFAWVVSRWPRRVFIPATFRFFAVNLLLFYGLLQFVPADRRVYVGYAFYIWLSVFNLFVVAVFWGFMADVFTLEQGKRLFGAIGVGGTLGAIGGAAVNGALVARLGEPLMLLMAIPFLEAAVQCMLAISRRVSARTGTDLCPACKYDLRGFREPRVA